MLGVTGTQHGLCEAGEQRRRGHATGASPASLPAASQSSLEACHAAKELPASGGTRGQGTRRDLRGRQRPGAAAARRGGCTPGAGSAVWARTPLASSPERGALRAVATLAGKGSPAAGHCPGFGGERHHTQCPSAPIRHVRAAAETPLPLSAEAAAPPPSRARRGCGRKGNTETGAALASVPVSPSRPAASHRQGCPPC